MVRAAGCAALWVVGLGLAAGCSAGDDGSGTASVSPSGGDPGGPPGEDGHDLLVAPLDGMQTQGRFLLGEKLDAVGREPGYHANLQSAAVTAGGEAVTVEFSGSAALRAGDHRGADPFFVGMTLTGSEGAHLRIVGVRGGSDIALYQVEMRGAAGWTNLCDADGDEAVPLAGKWQLTGLHEAAAGRFSFACTGSVAFKCALWGYLAGSEDGALGWRAHQACTRMARGDYCASGRSHTRAGTMIQIYDLVGVAAPPPQRFPGVIDWPPNIDRLFFEAAWNDGAQPASCLSRLRWQSLPTGPLCDQGALRDPRLDTGVQFCEDIAWPAAGTAPTGALLFNASYYSDLALHVWQRGDDLVSTVRGFYQVPGVIQPFPRIGRYEHVRNDGIVLRTLRDGNDPAEFEELRMYRRDGDLVVAGVSQPPPGFEAGAFEGYARKVAGSETVPLQLFVHTGTGDYVSTTAELPPPYQLQWTIGHVRPPETR